MPRIFSDLEMQRRVAELKATMDREGIACTIVTSVHNLVYLGGFFFAEPNGRFVAAVLPLKGDPAMITANTESSMEPGITVPGLGGFNTVDMILVTRDGSEVLTDYPRGLRSLDR